MLIDSPKLHRTVIKAVAHKAQHRVVTCGCQVTSLGTAKTDRERRRRAMAFDLRDFDFNMVPSNGSIRFNSIRVCYHPLRSTRLSHTCSDLSGFVPSLCLVVHWM